MVLGKRTRAVLFAAAIPVLLTAGRPAMGAMVDWPRRIGLPGGRAVLYEPKVEKHDGNDIEAVAAVAITVRDATSPVVGTVRFAGRVLAEMNSGMATLEIDRVIKADFPPGPDGDGINPAILAKSEMPRWNIPITVENYHSLLSAARKGRAVVGHGPEPGEQTEEELPRRPILTEYAGLTIMTSMHPEAEFPPSGTYVIRSIRVPPELEDGEAAVSHVRESLTGHLAGKGYRLEPNGRDPAFLVDMSFSFRQSREDEAALPTDPLVQNQKKPGKGILAVEIRNPESGRRMWRGTAEAQGILNTAGGEENGRVEFVVGRMLAGFPPRQIGKEPAGAEE